MSQVGNYSSRRRSKKCPPRDSTPSCNQPDPKRNGWESALLRPFKSAGPTGEPDRLGTWWSGADKKVGETAASHPWCPGVRPDITCDAEVVRTAAARLEPRPTDVTVIH